MARCLALIYAPAVQQIDEIDSARLGSAKTDPVRFKWGFGEGLGERLRGNTIRGNRPERF